MNEFEKDVQYKGNDFNDSIVGAVISFGFFSTVIFIVRYCYSSRRFLNFLEGCQQYLAVFLLYNMKRDVKWLLNYWRKHPLIKEKRIRNCSVLIRSINNYTILFQCINHLLVRMTITIISPC